MKNQSEVDAIVDDTLSTLLKIDPSVVRFVDRATTTSWSSLMHVEIFFSLEEQFGVKFEDDDIAFAESRDDLVAAVERALGLG